MAQAHTLVIEGVALAAPVRSLTIPQFVRQRARKRPQMRSDPQQGLRERKRTSITCGAKRQSCFRSVAYSFGINAIWPRRFARRLSERR